MRRHKEKQETEVGVYPLGSQQRSYGAANDAALCAQRGKYEAVAARVMEEISFSSMYRG